MSYLAIMFIKLKDVMKTKRIDKIM
jgi:hypothetical protein